MRRAFQNLAWAGSFALSAFGFSSGAYAQIGSAAASAKLAESDRLAIAREIVANGFPVDKREDMFGMAIDALLDQMRGTMFAPLKNDPGAEKLVNARLNTFITEGKIVLRSHIPSMMDALAEAYAREFTLAELGELREFSATQTGRHFFSRNSNILSDPSFRAANEAYMRDLIPSMEKMRRALMSDLSTYFAEHPPQSSSGS